MSDNHHEEAHTGPIKTPKQLLLASFFSFVIPIFAIIGLVIYVTSADKPAAGAVNPEKAIAERIQKVGMVEVRDANRPLKGGEEVFKAQCTACHTSGAAGAPKVGDAAAWSARIKTGFETLVQSALKGKGAMAPQGGGDFNDTEIARAVAYMANASGGKFDEPAMQAAIEPLRRQLRAAVAAQSPPLRRLAAIDAVLEKALAAREQALLALMPTLLERHFERLHRAPGGPAADAGATGAWACPPPCA